MADVYTEMGDPFGNFDFLEDIHDCEPANAEARFECGAADDETTPFLPLAPPPPPPPYAPREIQSPLRSGGPDPMFDIESASQPEPSKAPVSAWLGEAKQERSFAVAYLSPPAHEPEAFGKMVEAASQAPTMIEAHFQSTEWMRNAGDRVVSHLAKNQETTIRPNPCNFHPSGIGKLFGCPSDLAEGCVLRERLVARALDYPYPSYDSIVNMFTGIRQLWVQYSLQHVTGVDPEPSLEPICALQMRLVLLAIRHLETRPVASAPVHLPVFVQVYDIAPRDAETNAKIAYCETTSLLVLELRGGRITALFFDPLDKMYSPGHARGRARVRESLRLLLEGHADMVPLASPGGTNGAFRATATAVARFSFAACLLCLARITAKLPHAPDLTFSPSPMYTETLGRFVHALALATGQPPSAFIDASTGCSHQLAHGI